VNRFLNLATLALALACGSASGADPGYYVVTVYDNPGQKTLDLRYWTVNLPGSPTITWPEAGFGWNVNGRWYTELYGSWVGSADFATHLSTLNWQNDVLLTQGQYPFDLAVHTQLVRPENPASGYSFEIGPALQTEVGRTQLNLNVFFERDFAMQTATPTQMSYQWQVRQRWRPWLHFGAQGFGELGPWDHWSPHGSQSNRAGPALFGSIDAAPGTIGWQAAYLIGKTFGQRADMFTMRLKYDF
jgi:hypothetical protein